MGPPPSRKGIILSWGLPPMTGSCHSLRVAISSNTVLCSRSRRLPPLPSLFFCISLPCVFLHTYSRTLAVPHFSVEGKERKKETLDPCPPRSSETPTCISEVQPNTVPHPSPAGAFLCRERQREPCAGLTPPVPFSSCGVPSLYRLCPAPCPPRSPRPTRRLPNARPSQRHRKRDTLPTTHHDAE